MNSRKRPKLKIPKTKSEWVWDLFGYSCYIGSIILLIAVWGTLPEEIPGHFNALGEVDRWGQKWELWILPLIGLFTLLLMQTFERFPETHNYPERLNEKNAAQFYLNSRQMLNQIKNICLIFFSLVSLDSIAISMKWGTGFGIIFLPLLLIGTMVPIVVGIIKQTKIK